MCVLVVVPCAFVGIESIRLQMLREVVVVLCVLFVCKRIEVDRRIVYVMFEF